MSIVVSSGRHQAQIPLFFPMHEFAAKTSLVITPRPQRRFNALMIRPVK